MLIDRSKYVRGVVYLYTDTGSLVEENGQYVIHFPTKKHWRDQSKLEYVEAGVKDFWRIFESLKIKFVAIPALGCGCGGLYWAVVKPVIIEGLRSVEGPIKVMLFELELQKQQSCREH